MNGVGDVALEVEDLGTRAGRHCEPFLPKGWAKWLTAQVPSPGLHSLCLYWVKVLLNAESRAFFFQFWLAQRANTRSHLSHPKDIAV